MCMYNVQETKVCVYNVQETNSSCVACEEEATKHEDNHAHAHARQPKCVYV